MQSGVIATYDKVGTPPPSTEMVQEEGDQLSTDNLLGSIRVELDESYSSVVDHSGISEDIDIEVDNYSSTVPSEMSALSSLHSKKSTSALSHDGFSSRGSGSFGSAVNNESPRSLVTFASSVKSVSSVQSFESPKNSNSNAAAEVRKPPPAHGTIMREDSFDRKKNSYKFSDKADATMERAKILGINDYTFLRTLGKGAFAEVKLATKSKLENDGVVRDLNTDNYERYAIKVIKKNFLQEKRKFQQPQSSPSSSSSSSPITITTQPADKPKSQLNLSPIAENSNQRSSDISPPKSSRSLRMKNKRFSAPGNTTTDNLENSNGSAQQNGDQVAGVSTTSPSASPQRRPSPPSPTRQVTQNLPQEMIQELEILKYLRHPHLVKLCEIIDDANSKFLYVVLEYMEVGPIMVRDHQNSGAFISRLTNSVLLESMASTMFKDLLSALEYLHRNHIAHRDIKPDNLLVDFKGNLKVADFGVSSRFSEEKQKKAVDMRQLLRSKSRGVVSNTEGTFAFYCPEMCRENSGSYSAYMSDVWAASVCLWIFIFGRLPFYNADIVDLFSMIRHEEPTLPHRVSPELEHLFHRLLQKEQESRLSIHDIQQHCWLKRTPLRGSGFSNDDFETDDDLDTNVDDYHSLFSSRILSSVMRWVNSARHTCEVRRNKFKEERESELVSMLRRSSIAFTTNDKIVEEEELRKSDCDSSDDDDPLARLVSYDEIGGTVLEDMKKHEERHAAMKLLSALDEGDEKAQTPVTTPSPQLPKKSLRMGRSKRSVSSNNSELSDAFDIRRSYMKSSSSVSSCNSSSDCKPTQEVHEKLVQEALVELELEAFALRTNKNAEPEPEEKKSMFCCFC